MNHGTWSELEAVLFARLDDEDDRELWKAVCSSVYQDAESLVQDVVQSVHIVTEIGKCSRWLRPHQTRWTADGGFAWPTGYGGAGYSREGLPEFDWSCVANWDPAVSAWVLHSGRAFDSTRVLRFRVAVPSRTMRHQQAAIHTVWTPGPPQHRRQELLQLYGLRRLKDGWGQTAYDAWPDEKAYELAVGAL